MVSVAMCIVIHWIGPMENQWLNNYWVTMTTLGYYVIWVLKLKRIFVNVEVIGDFEIQMRSYNDHIFPMEWIIDGLGRGQ